MPKNDDKALFNGCVLMRQRSSNKLYWDFFVCWCHQDKFYRIRVKPCFINDLKLFMAHSVLVPDDEPLEKYF